MLWQKRHVSGDCHALSKETLLYSMAICIANLWHFMQVVNQQSCNGLTLPCPTCRSLPLRKSLAPQPNPQPVLSR